MPKLKMFGLMGPNRAYRVELTVWGGYVPGHLPNSKYQEQPVDYTRLPHAIITATSGGDLIQRESEKA